MTRPHHQAANDVAFREDGRAEKNLWIAVLDQAVEDAGVLAQKVCDEPDLWGLQPFRLEVRQLMRFFNGRSMELGSFRFICSLIECNPDHLRSRLEAMHLKHLIRPDAQTTPLYAAA
ncbi:MAG: hypothetical protein HQL53_08560 [Magnetococcales bacterium]|nr:hypothetical protein [Magnetococcales bacterium]